MTLEVIGCVHSFSYNITLYFIEYIMESTEDLLGMNLAELKQLASFYLIDNSGDEADLILRLQQFLSSEDFDDTFYSLSAPGYVAQNKRHSGEVSEKVFRKMRKRTVSDSSIRSYRRNSLDGITDYTGRILYTKVSLDFIEDDYFITVRFTSLL